MRDRRAGGGDGGRHPHLRHPAGGARRGGGAVAAPLRLEHTDLAGAARLAAACGSANCRSVVPGLVTRDLVRQLAAQVTIAESRP